MKKKKKKGVKELDLEKESQSDDESNEEGNDDIINENDTSNNLEKSCK